MRCRPVSALLVLSVLLGLHCASLRGPSLEDTVQSAESPSDHLRIVESYRRAAAEARDDAAEHERLAEVYAGRHRWGMAFAARAGQHCNELAALSQQRAARYDALASEHERLAQE